MDDDKKKKETAAIEIGIAFLILAAVITLNPWSKITGFFTQASSPFAPLFSVVNWNLLWVNLYKFLEFLIGLSIPLSVFFLIGIIYAVEQLKVVRRKEAEKHDVKVEPAYEGVAGAAAGNSDLSARWKKIQDLLGSQNENDWKQAILEADQMLDMILDGLGYKGESIGEKLKRVGPGEMKAVDDAWEAHKVRNDIAHRSSLHLSQHDANEAIQRYRRVFEEFYFI